MARRCYEAMSVRKKNGNCFPSKCFCPEFRNFGFEILPLELLPEVAIARRGPAQDYHFLTVMAQLIVSKLSQFRQQSVI